VTKELKPWSITASRITYRDRWITLRSDDCLTAEGVTVAPFHVLEYPDWVTVVPILPDGRVMMVREYRHGRGDIVTGFVSGAVEADDGSDELAAMEAARRELLEETGHDAARFIKVLTSLPNATNQTNRVTTWLALDAVKVAEPRLEAGEAVEVVLRDLADVLGELRSGTLIMQAMHVAALYAADDWLRTYASKDLK